LAAAPTNPIADPEEARRFLADHPGIAFFEAAVLMLIALVLAFRSFKLDDRIAARS